MANIMVSDSLRPSGRNKPLDARTVVNTESEIARIPVPFVGMIVYVKDTGKYYSIKTLKASAGGIENSAVERYEPLTSGGGTGGGSGTQQTSFKKSIASSDWSSEADEDGFYSISIRHNLESESVQVSVINTDTQTNVFEIFTIIDEDNIKLMNDEKINCEVIIN